MMLSLADCLLQIDREMLRFHGKCGKFFGTVSVSVLRLPPANK